MNHETPRVEIRSVAPATHPGRVLASAWIRLYIGGMQIGVGPFSILDNDGSSPKVATPTVRFDGAWHRVLDLPMDLRAEIEDVVLAEWQAMEAESG